MDAPRMPADLLGGHLHVLADAVATGRQPDRRTLERCRDAGTAAAEQGVPLREVIDEALRSAEALATTGPSSASRSNGPSPASRSAEPMPADLLAALRKAVRALMDAY